MKNPVNPVNPVKKRQRTIMMPELKSHTQTPCIQIILKKIFRQDNRIKRITNKILSILLILSKKDSVQ